jgi:hypothetical protein
VIGLPGLSRKSLAFGVVPAIRIRSRSSNSLRVSRTQVLHRGLCLPSVIFVHTYTGAVARSFFPSAGAVLDSGHDARCPVCHRSGLAYLSGFGAVPYILLRCGAAGPIVGRCQTMYCRPNGTPATSPEENAELAATHFEATMTYPDYGPTESLDHLPAQPPAPATPPTKNIVLKAQRRRLRVAGCVSTER